MLSTVFVKQKFRIDRFTKSNNIKCTISHTRTRTHARTRTHTRMRHARMHAHTRTQTHTHTHARTHARARTYTHTHTHTHTSMHSAHSFKSVRAQNSDVPTCLSAHPIFHSLPFKSTSTRVSTPDISKSGHVIDQTLCNELLSSVLPSACIFRVANVQSLLSSCSSLSLIHI